VKYDQIIAGLLLSLVLAGTAQARVELHYFTSTTCGPCVPVTKIVNALNADNRDITVHVWQQNEAPFRYYGVNFLPAFVTVEDGKKLKHYVQENEVGGFRFTPSFVSGLAPFKSVQLDQKPRDCANPIGKAFRNLIPPPPAPGLPDDIPDRVKVKRIEDLEKLIQDQALTINVLRKALSDIEAKVAGLKSGEQGPPGKDGERGPAGPPGRDGVDDRPIAVRINIVDDAGNVVDTKTDTYPRGTPIVLRFSERLLKQ